MKKISLNILYFLLVLTTVGEIFYVSLSSAITTTRIKETIKENLLEGFIYNDNGTKTEIFNTILRLTTLDEETVIKLMENETADNIITDVVNSIYDYNLTGDARYKYTKTKIISLVEDNIDKVLAEINYNISVEDRKAALDYTYGNTDYILKVIYDTNIGDYQRW